MKIKRSWEETEVTDGIKTVTVGSWQSFIYFFQDEMLLKGCYIYRGQRDERWHLQPTLHRMLKRLNRKEDDDWVIKEHLNNFKYAIRGRRGKTPVKLNDENEWWAIGQHYGLATPLLDWTNSPFVAAYFAFIENSIDNSTHRAIYALERGTLDFGIEFLQKPSCPNNDKLEIVKPLTDENARLLNQNGLFVRVPMQYPNLETWVREHFKDDPANYLVLIKILVNNDQREVCLKSLHSMNINHITLFPDLTGSSIFCNLALEIQDYHYT